MNQYETVFILNPVLSEDQVKEAVDKYVKRALANCLEMIDIYEALARSSLLV